MKLIWSMAVCLAIIGKAVQAGAKISSVYAEFGQNLGATVPERIQYLLGKAGVTVFPYSVDVTAESDSLILSFGNATLSNKYLSLADVKDEGFRIVAQPYEGSNLIMSNGQPINMKGKSSAMNLDAVHYGAVVGAYAVLEQLGFAFLHPMDPIIPNMLSLPASDISKTESPYWPTRTWHIHTQHPLEFTEVLNGFDIPMFAHYDDTANAAGSTIAGSTAGASAANAEGQSVFAKHSCLPGQYCESWESMLSTLDGLFEWFAANRQNRVEVLLLGSPKWDAYNNLTTGTQRQQRLQRINTLSHSYGILIGADIPIANRQQHGWKMISLTDNFAKQSADIQQRVDWAFAADYDFISTESGLSEFTKPSCDLMLSLFQVFTQRIAEHWNREAVTKVHCSTSQFCDEKDEAGNWKYPDPRTGEPINFNMLPTYAAGGLGVMPHTVQVYSFSDPTAGSYGNENFTYMSEYMNWEAGLGKRDVLYYAETAYWVNVDVDVPLFLPLSGQRRLADLRYTAQLEAAQGFRITGQVNFESGWEFGFYLSNAVTARAIWNPRTEIKDDWQAYSASLDELLSTVVFGSFAAPLRDAIIALAKVQTDLMVFSRVNGQPSTDLTKLSGHAYMSGSDSWVDLERMLGVSITQPDKIHLQETDDPNWGTMLQLLAELKEAFALQAQHFNDIVKQATNAGLPAQPLKYVQEIADAVQVQANRAKHNTLLYKAVDPSTSSTERTALLLQGRHLLAETDTVMQRLVEGFRVPADRISGWRQGPTVYPFGYVWAARSLYYFWRDQGVAEARTQNAASSPCYLNRQEPLELAFGWGKALEQVLRVLLKKKGLPDSDLDPAVVSMMADCLAPPVHEFKFPRDL